MLGDLYKVVYAQDGLEAMDVIKREYHTLSLVLLDLHMPKLDGFTLLKSFTLTTSCGLSLSLY